MLQDPDHRRLDQVLTFRIQIPRADPSHRVAQDALGRLSEAGVRVLLVGLPVLQVDLLERLQLIPAVVPRSDVFEDFTALRAALPARLAELRERDVSPASA